MKMFSLANTSTTKKKKELEDGPSEPESERSGTNRSTPLSKRSLHSAKNTQKLDDKKRGPLQDLNEPSGAFQKTRSSKANVKSFAESSAP